MELTKLASSIMYKEAGLGASFKNFLSKLRPGASKIKALESELAKTKEFQNKMLTYGLGGAGVVGAGAYVVGKKRGKTQAYESLGVTPEQVEAMKQQGLSQ